MCQPGNFDTVLLLNIYNITIFLAFNIHTLQTAYLYGNRDTVIEQYYDDTKCVL